MSLLDDDLESILEDFTGIAGAVVVWRGSTLSGILSTREVTRSGFTGEASRTPAVVLSVRTSDKPAAGRKQDTLTIDGASYKVDDILKDGALGRITHVVVVAL